MVGLWAAGCLSALRAGGKPGAGAASGTWPTWRAAAGPERYLTATHDGLRLEVRLEDSDPLRDRLGLTPAPPLTDAEVARWQDALDRRLAAPGRPVPPGRRDVAAVLA